MEGFLLTGKVEKLVMDLS